jgi:hypothetical protein
MHAILKRARQGSALRTSHIAARRTLGYGAVLLAGVSLAAMLLPERTATAQSQPERIAPVLPLARHVLIPEAPAVQIAQATQLTPGRYANPATLDSAGRLTSNMDFILASCDTFRSMRSSLERDLQRLQALADALPTFVAGQMRPAGARRDGVYADGQARGHDGDLVRQTLRDYRARVEQMTRQCAPRPTTTPPTATPPRAPQRAPDVSSGPFAGPTLEPWIAGAIRDNRASGAYASNGSQPAGSGTGSKDQGNFCGGVDAALPLGGPLSSFLDFLGQEGVTAVWFGSTQIGARIGICELGSGEKVVFKEVRHPGADGVVTLSEKERAEITLMLIVRQLFFIDIGGILPREARRGAQYAAADIAQAMVPRARNYWPFMIYAGVGPSFMRTRIDMSSNQTGAGGRIETASLIKWDSGISFVVGGQTALCRNCAFGNPVMFGVEGQWTRLPARDISVTSSAFGFTESGRVGSRSSSRISFKVTVPFAIGR